MLGGDSKVVAQQLRDLSAASQCFKVKGGGHVIALFGVLTDAWLSVNQVRCYLLNRGVSVHRNTVRTALNQLVELAIVERSGAVESSGKSGRYRRTLSDAARSLKERKAERELRGLHAKALRRKFLSAQSDCS